MPPEPPPTQDQDATARDGDAKCAPMPRRVGMTPDEDRSPKGKHDRALFEELLATVRLIEPHVRTGSMFGCPAVYCGRNLAACVYGAAVAMRVPASTAAQALKRARAVP